jgi:hypothetical protein
MSKKDKLKNTHLGMGFVAPSSYDTESELVHKVVLNTIKVIFEYRKKHNLQDDKKLKDFLKVRK